jgi:N-acetylmuramoyl-L-alanine amidase
MKSSIIAIVDPKRFFTSAAVCMLFFLSLGAFVSWAQETTPTPVKIRAARHQDSVRVVFTTEDFLVKNASVILTKNKTIRIDLHSAAAAAAGREKPAISFETEKGQLKSDTPVELIKSVTLAAKGDSCIITIPNVEDIKVSKLQSPPRIVIDALFITAPKEAAAPAVPPRPLTDQISFKHIVIDAGHGGYDYGIRGAHFAEKDFVLLFARDFASLLAKSGKEALLTRKSDQIMNLAERIEAVNKKPPDLVISFHVASTKVPVLYTIPGKTDSSLELSAERNGDLKKMEIATGIADSIAVNMEKDLSVKAVKEILPLSLLMKSKAPAILIELPNPDEFTYDKKGRERLMSSILKGLAAGVKEEKPAAPTAPKPEARPLNKATDKGEKM